MMYPVYNNELKHFGVKGMKWGRSIGTKVSKHEQNYKEKLKAIANNKNAHAYDREVANVALKSGGAKVTGAIIGSVGRQVLADFMTGNIKNYGKEGVATSLNRIKNVGISAGKELAFNEAAARSVASKYDTKGNRIKGDVNEKYTREQKAASAFKTAQAAKSIAVSLGKFAAPPLAAKMRKKQNNKKAYENMNGRILNAKNKDYSNYVTNVKYEVK